MSASHSSQTRTDIIPATGQQPETVVVRSTRRTKTVSARMDDDGRIRLLVPASTTEQEARDYVHRLLPKIMRGKERQSSQKNRFTSDSYLVSRAEQLIENYLPGMELPESIRWVTNQSGRWASATPSRGRIRISHVIQGAPDYVIDFVLYHELCHFAEANHSQKFRALENQYPRKAEAEAFLEGITFSQRDR